MFNVFSPPKSNSERVVSLAAFKEIAAGCGLIRTFADWTELQPELFFTAKVYDPAGRPVIVLLFPFPLVVIPPGVLVITQFPVAGKLVNTTLPVDKLRVGCVIAPI